jgi:hydroxymethylglutaryl-CoA lyase
LILVLTELALSRRKQFTLPNEDVPLRLVPEVLIEDEALRDGLQNEKREFSVAEKLRVVDGLVAAGLRRIQVGSFVHPKWVPQMANTDEVFATLKPVDGVTYTALILNMAGLERALVAGVKHLSISVSASETHSRKNTNKSVSEALAAITPTLERALTEGIAVRAGIQSALGCGFEGAIPRARVVDIAGLYSRIGIHEINIADSAGLGNPKQVYETVEAVRGIIRPEIKISLHLHDTRGLGLANMFAGLQAGVTIYDAAVGGLGGCPFIPSATGNIATEDVVYMLDEMGVKTGVDWRKLCAITLELETTLSRKLPSRMAHIGPVPEALI